MTDIVGRPAKLPGTRNSIMECISCHKHIEDRGCNFCPYCGTPTASPSEHPGYGLEQRAQALETIVWETLAGAPWREISSEVMQTYGITPAEVDAEVSRRLGVEENFLRRVILHIAIQRAIADPTWRTALASVLEKIEIAEEEVEVGAKQRRYEMEENVQTQLPKTDEHLRFLSGLLSNNQDSYAAISRIKRLGSGLCCAKRFAEAELVLQYTMAIIPRLPNNPHRDTLIRNAADSLSFLYEQTKQYAEAERYLDVFIGNDKPSHVTLLSKANLCLKQQKLDQAQCLYLQAMAGLDELQRVDTEYNLFPNSGKRRARIRIEMLVGLGQVYIEKRDLNKAEMILDEANCLAKSLNQLFQFEIWRLFSQLHLLRGNVGQAKEFLRLCIKLLEESPARTAPALVDLMTDLKAQYAKCNEPDQPN